MGSIRVGVADALNDRQPALLEELPERGHLRVQAHSVVEPDDLLFWQSLNVRPIAVVEGVSNGITGVQAVVTAAENSITTSA